MSSANPVRIGDVMDLENFCWTLSAATLAILTVVLWVDARDAMAFETQRALAWCGPGAHRTATPTFFGHCAHCWPAMTATVVAVAAVGKALFFGARTPREAA